MKHMLLFIICSCLFAKIEGFSLNATGASFPDQVYQQAVFAYKFSQPRDMVSYVSTGSGCGRCNIQGNI